MTKENDKYRIEALLNHLKLSRNALGVAIGDTNGSKFNHIISGRNGISEKLAKKITDIYPEINYDWLTEGKGEMLVVKKEKNQIDNDNEPVLVKTITGEKINIDIIIDTVLINQEDFELNKRFRKYLDSVRNKAIIEYQEKLLFQMKKEGR